jgi:hypothetical protein
MMRPMVLMFMSTLCGSLLRCQRSPDVLLRAATECRRTIVSQRYITPISPREP